MAKKAPADEFEITDDDLSTIGGKKAADPAVIDADAEVVTKPDAAEIDPGFEASESLKEQLETLKKQNEEAEAHAKEVEAALATERQATATERAKTAVQATQLVDSRLETVARAIEADDARMKDAKVRQIAAMTEGDYAKSADIGAEMAEIAANKQRHEEGRNQLELQIERAKEAPPQKSQQEQLTEWINGLPSAQRDWGHQHRNLFEDPVMARKVALAHNDAVLNDIAEGSAKYFEHIETRLGLRQPVEQEIVTQRRDTAPPAAPVSRGSTSMANGKTLTDGKVRLPPEMAEAATISGLTPREYWDAMTPEEKARVTRH